jgi:enoyl-CoA hydratase/carnithine racemase
LSYETVLYDVSDQVATVTLNRPEVMNAFNQKMCDELQDVWGRARRDDDVRVIVIQANGDRAFCVGVDRKHPQEGSSSGTGYGQPDNPFARIGPDHFLGPKTNQLWKPVVCAVHGMVAGGAAYFTNESDIVICSEDAMFFDPHLNYGMVSVLENVGMGRRIPVGEALRLVLLGLDERMSATRAHQIGLVSEVVPIEELRERARDLALKIAKKPPIAVQGTIKALWAELDLTSNRVAHAGPNYSAIGNPIGHADPDALKFGDQRPKWELR